MRDGERTVSARAGGRGGEAPGEMVFHGNTFSFTMSGVMKIGGGVMVAQHECA